ncbi:MAG: 50S ribosomal protein L10 [Candidatus Muproteobacteria bacterium RBG_16_60_9]|uniref:Large ribosomal subunit protein uL10 n=1 Tax=Candidatus Muproteobacteria bacterium RBG_16_60_9 TaxID=1817755 RepID=A0A1F6UY70_9PROT|nr:MAG: 50S ribosomal protein L10 [Candidatus Muproteobacteria bacterium RBG_16_60_9]
MSLNIEQKKAVVAEVAEQFQGAEAAVLAEYRGLSVAQMTALRGKARQAQIYVRVVKNTLTRRAIAGSKYECLSDLLFGPLALAISKDPVAVAKLLAEFAKDNAALKIRAGAMGGKLMSLEQVQALAKLPSREQLLAILVGTLQAPITKFVRTLNEVPARFVRTLAAVRDAKGSAA